MTVKIIFTVVTLVIMILIMNGEDGKKDDDMIMIQ
jgi:hypothetical protein